ncbi:Hypothetical protein SCF082_LOCUS14556 [Durusdinium trenchii]|uniref:Uncharacterized protein n=1 Tax=Durusdinium trenchii TaxID=1381693 RepID=A0ABP0JYY0_9DINO
MWWRSCGTSFDISSIFAVTLGARFPPDEAKVQGKDLPAKTDVGVAHILDANTGLGINYAVMAWHWSMVLVFLICYFATVVLTTPMNGASVPWLTLFQKLLVFWNMWEALGLGVISGPMHAKVNPPFQDWWYRFTVGSMKYNAPFMPCLPMKRNYLDVFVEGFLVYVLTIRVLLSPEVTPALMQPLTACLSGYKDPEADYSLTRTASAFSAFCALCETLGPILVLSNDPTVVSCGIIFICCMHLYIISTLIVDVFTWNFVDAMMYCFLFGLYGPSVGRTMGFQWRDISSMHPVLMAFLLAHAIYSIYGNFFPNQVPYVVAHRHAAGNFAMGTLLVKVSAAAKLGKVVAHSGCPVVKGAPAPGWIGDWLGFHLLMAYFWLWNLPHRMLLPLTYDQVSGKEETHLMSTYVHDEEFIMLHSVLVFDALCAHVRFDGLSSLALVRELGNVCGFEEGECTLCWVGAFPSFPAQLFNSTAQWKVVDSIKGVLRQGTYTVQDVEDAAYKKPSDCKSIKLFKKLSMSQTLVLEEEELLRFNDTEHWKAEMRVHCGTVGDPCGSSCIKKYT